MVDIGCGTGQMALALEDYLSDKGAFYGTDIGREGIEFCRRTYRRSNFKFATGDMTRVPFADRDGPFDLAIFFSVFTHTFVDESVLLRVLGSGEVMREQLEPLIARAQEPHVPLQTVPLDATNASAPAIPVTYLRFGGLELPDVVYLEHIRSATFLEDRDETEEYRVVLDRLADEAPDPRESPTLLRETGERRGRAA